MVVTTFLQRSDSHISICLAQIHVQNECINMPDLIEYQLFPERNIVRKGLANFSGILTGYSDQLKSM